MNAMAYKHILFDRHILPFIYILFSFLFILTCFSLSFTRFHRFISFLLFLVWVRLISVNQWFCVRCIETEAEPFQVTFVFCGHF